MVQENRLKFLTNSMFIVATAPDNVLGPGDVSNKIKIEKEERKTHKYQPSKLGSVLTQKREDGWGIGRNAIF